MLLESPLRQSPVLAIVTYTTKFDTDGRQVLSVPSQLCAEAGIELAHQLECEDIWIAGEHTYEKSSSTGKLIKESISHHARGEFTVSLLCEDNSELINTPTQIEALATKQRKEKLGGKAASLIIVGLGFHLNRIERYCETFDLRLAGQPIAAEEILQIYNPGTYGREIAALKDFKRAERLINYASILDRRGRLLTLVSKALGPRTQDIVEKDGVMRGVNGHAPRFKHQINYEAVKDAA